MAHVTYRGQEPFYVGWEHGAEGRILSKSWFHETEAPYRAGKALRIRIGPRALHLGICGKAKRPVVRDTEIQVEEIKKWVYD